MAKGLKNESLKGRNFALTIILGIFIAIMSITLVNLIVSYAYPAPEYNSYCNSSNYNYAYPDKPYLPQSNNVSCSFNSKLNDDVDACVAKGGNPVYQYNSVGCSVALKNCDMCAKQYDSDLKVYNRISFFVFAIIGFVLIVVGLFVSPLLMQLVLLPSGAILVIEAAMNNFDNKLAVIIVLALLVVGAVFLALKKLR